MLFSGLSIKKEHLTFNFGEPGGRRALAPVALSLTFLLEMLLLDEGKHFPLILCHLVLIDVLLALLATFSDAVSDGP